MDYLADIMDAKKVPPERKKLLLNMWQNKVDYRALCKLKTYIFDKCGTEKEISCDEWKLYSKRFMHIFTEEIEDQMLEDISIEGKVDRNSLSDLLDIY